MTSIASIGFYPTNNRKELFSRLQCFEPSLFTHHRLYNVTNYKSKNYYRYNKRTKKKRRRDVKKKKEKWKTQ